MTRVSQSILLNKIEVLKLRLLQCREQVNSEQLLKLRIKRKLKASLLSIKATEERLLRLRNELEMTAATVIISYVRTMLKSNCPLKSKAATIIIKAARAFLVRRRKTLEYLISLQDEDPHHWELHVLKHPHIPTYQIGYCNLCDKDGSNGCVCSESSCDGTYMVSSHDHGYGTNVE